MPKAKFDYLFLFSVLALSAIGLIMIFSASPTMALKLGDSYYYLKRHILYLLLGFSALYFGLRADLGFLKKWAGLIFALSVFLLFLVYIPGVGKKISGASRWIDLAIFTFQPSEVIKFTMILFLASIISNFKEKDKIKDFIYGLLPLLVLLGGVLSIIILQPDLGTALTIAATSFIMMFAAGAQILHLSLLSGLGILAALGLSLAVHTG